MSTVKHLIAVMEGKSSSGIKAKKLTKSKYFISQRENGADSVPITDCTDQNTTSSSVARTDARTKPINVEESVLPETAGNLSVIREGNLSADSLGSKNAVHKENGLEDSFITAHVNPERNPANAEIETTSKHHIEAPTKNIPKLITIYHTTDLSKCGLTETPKLDPPVATGQADMTNEAKPTVSLFESGIHENNLNAIDFISTGNEKLDQNVELSESEIKVLSNIPGNETNAIPKLVTVHDLSGQSKKQSTESLTMDPPVAKQHEIETQERGFGELTPPQNTMNMIYAGVSSEPNLNPALSESEGKGEPDSKEKAAPDSEEKSSTSKASHLHSDKLTISVTPETRSSSKLAGLNTSGPESRKTLAETTEQIKMKKPPRPTSETNSGRKSVTGSKTTPTVPEDGMTPRSLHKTKSQSAEVSLQVQVDVPSQLSVTDTQQPPQAPLVAESISKSARSESPPADSNPRRNVARNARLKGWEWRFEIEASAPPLKRPAAAVKDPIVKKQRSSPDPADEPKESKDNTGPALGSILESWNQVTAIHKELQSRPAPPTPPNAPPRSGERSQVNVRESSSGVFEALDIGDSPIDNRKRKRQLEQNMHNSLKGGNSISNDEKKHVHCEALESEKEREDDSEKNSNSSCRALDLYYQDHFADLMIRNPSLSSAEIVALAGKLWRMATHEEKRPYLERALQEIIQNADQNKSVAPKTTNDVVKKKFPFTLPRASAGAKHTTSEGTLSESEHSTRTNQTGNSQKHRPSSLTPPKRTALMGKITATKSPAFIRPKIPAFRNQDGSYNRPTGRGPLGYSWKPSIGLWVPSATMKQSDSAADVDTKGNASSYDDSGKAVTPMKSLPKNLVGKYRLLGNGRLRPLVFPRKDNDGKFIKPAGRPPAGFIWDRLKGEWTPASATLNDVEEKADRTVSKDTFNGQKGTESSVNEAVAPSLQTLGGGSHTDFSVNAQQSSEFDFDKLPGVDIEHPDLLVHNWKMDDFYIEHDADFLAVDTSKISNTPNTFWPQNSSPVDRSSVLLPSSSLMAMHRADNGYNLPKTTPRRITDGSFRKPKGRPPLGYKWDNLRGEWVPSAQSDSETKRYDMGRQTLEAKLSTHSCDPADSLSLKTPQAEVSSLSLDKEKVVGSEVDRALDGHSEEIISAQQTHYKKSFSSAYDREGIRRQLRHRALLRKSTDGGFRRPTGRSPKGCEWDAEKGEWIKSGNHATRKSSPTHERNEDSDDNDTDAHKFGSRPVMVQPNFVACGLCQNCKTDNDCGTCLNCMMLPDYFHHVISAAQSGIVIPTDFAPKCASRICLQPVRNPVSEENRNQNRVDASDKPHTRDELLGASAAITEENLLLMHNPQKNLHDDLKM